MKTPDPTGDPNGSQDKDSTEEPLSPAAPYGGSYGRYGRRGYPTRYSSYGAYGPTYGTYASGSAVGGDEGGIFSDLTFSKILRLVQRKWITVFCAMLLGGAFGYYQIQRTPEVYATTSLFELNLRRPRILTNREAIIDPTIGSRESFATYLEILRGSAVRKMAAEIVREDDPDLAISDAELLDGMVHSMTVVGGSRLIRIGVRHRQAKLAAALANAFAKAAKRTIFEENRAASDSAVAWLKAQAVTSKQTLDKNDALLLRFRETSQIDMLEDRRRQGQTVLDGITTRLLELQIQRASELEAQEILSATVVTPEGLRNMPTSVPLSDLVRKLSEELHEAVRRREQFAQRYTAEHPALAAQTETVARLRAELQEQVKILTMRAAANVNLLTSQIEQLEETEARLREEGASLDLKLVHLRMREGGLKRERSASDVSYLGILKRIEEARLAHDENTASVKILELAAVPAKPIEPDPGRIMFIALLWGLAAGVGIALIADWLEDYIWSAADVEKGLGLQILGLIPHIETEDRRDAALICNQQKNSLVLESFAGIRGVLTAATKKQMCHSLLVTSSSPQEGKTVCSTNLAIMFAKSGIRTVIIDLDLRIPRLRRVFELPNDVPNVTPILRRADNSAFATLPQRTHVENLDVICSLSEQGSSPAEVLGSNALVDFIAWAKSEYEQVVVDSPPFGAVSDSSIIAGLVDGVILVAREKKSRKGSIRRAIRHFHECGGQVIGCIMNDLRFRSSKYGYANAYAYIGSHYHNRYNHYRKYQDRHDVESDAAEAVASGTNGQFYFSSWKK